VIEALSEQSMFEADIGPDICGEWKEHLTSLGPQRADKLPEPFRDWGMRHHPEVAAVGASDLADIQRLSALQELLRARQCPPAAPTQYVGGAKELRAALAGSQSAKISFCSKKAKPDVSGTWTKGVNTNFSGLWAGAGCQEPTTVRFAAGTVTADAAFGHSRQHVVRLGASPRRIRESRESAVEARPASQLVRHVR
jgi:hypothetical protein